MTPHRAHFLHSNGYKSVVDVANADPIEISRLLQMSQPWRSEFFTASQEGSPSASQLLASASQLGVRVGKETSKLWGTVHIQRMVGRLIAAAKALIDKQRSSTALSFLTSPVASPPVAVNPASEGDESSEEDEGEWDLYDVFDDTSGSESSSSGADSLFDPDEEEDDSDASEDSDVDSVDGILRRTHDAAQGTPIAMRLRDYAVDMTSVNMLLESKPHGVPDVSARSDVVTVLTPNTVLQPLQRTYSRLGAPSRHDNRSSSGDRHQHVVKRLQFEGLRSHVPPFNSSCSGHCLSGYGVDINAIDNERIQFQKVSTQPAVSFYIVTNRSTVGSDDAREVPDANCFLCGGLNGEVCEMLTSLAGQASPASGSAVRLVCAFHCYRCWCILFMMCACVPAAPEWNYVLLGLS